MAQHRFTVGQSVRLSNRRGLSARADETYRITGALPERDNSPQYRIRSEAESHERMATEDILEPIDAPAAHRTTLANNRHRGKQEVVMNFVVVPVGRNPKFGFWVQAEDAEEARKLVSLNVPEMAGVTIPDHAQCNPDQTYSPIHGVIFEGSGRSYTITRRGGKAPGELGGIGDRRKGLTKQANQVDPAELDAAPQKAPRTLDPHKGSTSHGATSPKGDKDGQRTEA